MTVHARSVLSRPPAQLVQVGLLALLGWTAASLWFPEPASAWLQQWLTEGMNDSVNSGVKTLLESLFGKGNNQYSFTDRTLKWLVALPHYQGKDDIEDVRKTLDAAAFGMLGLVATLSVIRFWLADLSGSGSAVTALLRTIGAAAIILVWPWVFQSTMMVTNALTYSLLNADQTSHKAGQLMTDAVAVGALATGGGVGIVSIVVVTVATLLALGLFLMKLLLGAGLALVYVIMPLAAVLWGLPGFDWLAPATGKALAVLALWPVIWVVLFKLAVAFPSDYGEGDGNFLDQKVAEPMMGIVVLFLCIKLPTMLGRAAFQGVPGGGGGGFMGKYLAMQAVKGGALGQKAASLLGGKGASTPRNPYGGRSGPPAGTKGETPPAGAKGATPTAAETAKGTASTPHGGNGVPGTAPSAASTNGSNGSKPVQKRLPDPRTVAPRARALQSQMKTNATTGNRDGTTYPPSRQGLDGAMSALGDDGHYLVNKMNSDGNIREAAAYHGAVAEISGDAAKQDAWMAIGSAEPQEAKRAVGRWAAQQNRTPPPPSSGGTPPPKGAPPPPTLGHP